MKAIKSSGIHRWKAGDHYSHRNLVVMFRRHKIELEHSAGTRDETWVYLDGDSIYVLTLNTSLGYVGLGVYLPVDGTVKEHRAAFETDGGWYYYSHEPVSSVFMQSDHEIESALGKKGLSLSPATMVRRLMEYL